MATIEVRRNAAKEITSYRVEWYDNGTRHRQTLKTEESAKMWKNLLEATKHDTAAAEQALLRQTSQSPTCATVASDHIDRLINVRDYTSERYRGYVRNHLGNLASIPIDEVTEDDMIRWIQQMTKKGSSPKTVSNVHGFIHGFMNTAVRRCLRADNPCNGRLLPKDNSTEDKAVFMTMEQVNRVIEGADEWQQPMWHFLIGSGLRLGEATALTPADFQLDAATPSVRVTKSWQDTKKSGWQIGPPKTKKARRTVALAPSTVAQIRGRIESTRPGSHVFTLYEGVQIFPQHRQWLDGWYSAIKWSGIELERRPRIHDIRHSHASMMIAGGMNLYELANRLGHESIVTTTKTYGHLVPDAHFRAAAMVEKALTAIQA